ncbi:MAG: 4-(cytidine 5'-diphospho)-2-C-methyl-D-erythritol kinase [Pseudomonadota bacterium]
MQTGFAPAKVNLTLHVVGRRTDGYHLLDSVVMFADVGDWLTVGPGDDLTVTGPFAQGVPTDGGNLIRRALSLARARRAVTLDKRLPHPAGMGGGSSDAACALRMVDHDLTPQQVLTLGADLPVCLLGQAARMQGIGDRVTPLALPMLHGVLINPSVAVPTGPVFQALTQVDGPGHGDALPDFADGAALTEWLRAQRNDLEPAARAIAPAIDDVLSALRQAGASLARMSGSGATCFGLWPTRIAAERAAETLARPGWWVQAASFN